MSGKPASRIGDGVSHGVIVQGSATVLIGSLGGVACSVCPGGMAVGSPVNPALGAKVLSGEVDFALPAAALPLVWQRSYSSYVNPEHGGTCGVDWVTGTWFIPKANAKGRRKKKQDHYVFLSDFARRQFVELQKITGKSAWLFPARDNKIHICVKTISKQVGDRQMRFKCGKPLAHRRQDDSLILANSVNGKWTPHDMRRTGATMMQ